MFWKHHENTIVLSDIVLYYCHSTLCKGLQEEIRMLWWCKARHLYAYKLCKNNDRWCVVGNLLRKCYILPNHLNVVLCEVPTALGLTEARFHRRVLCFWIHIFLCKITWSHYPSQTTHLNFYINNQWKKYRNFFVKLLRSFEFKETLPVHHWYALFPLYRGAVGNRLQRRCWWKSGTQITYITSPWTFNEYIWKIPQTSTA